MAEISVVEETFKQISSHKGIEGILVLNEEGIPIRSTLESSLSVQYAGLISHFVNKSRSAMRQLNLEHPEDDLQSIRIRSKIHEIIIAPEFTSGHDYTLVVVQKPFID